MSQWCYSKLGKTEGPVSERVLIDLVLLQDLEPDCYVMNMKDGMWKKLNEIPELHNQLLAPEPAFQHTAAESKALGKIAGGAEDKVTPLYFYIPVEKLIIYSFLTFGLYQLYWWYRQWHYWAAKHGQAGRSFDREIGWMMFDLMLFDKISRDKELNAVVRCDFDGGRLFWGWIIIGLIIGSVQMALHLDDTGLSVLYLFCYGFPSLAILPVQTYINQVNRKLGRMYSPRTKGHYIVMFLAVAEAALYLLSMAAVPLLKQFSPY